MKPTNNSKRQLRWVPRIHTNQLAIRILGSLAGIGFLAIGAYSFFGGDDLDAYTRDRANGFALAASVAGIWAIAVSWLDSDLTNVWCRAPKSGRKF